MLNGLFRFAGYSERRNLPEPIPHVRLPRLPGPSGLGTQDVSDGV